MAAHVVDAAEPTRAATAEYGNDGDGRRVSASLLVVRTDGSGHRTEVATRTQTTYRVQGGLPVALQERVADGTTGTPLGQRRYVWGAQELECTVETLASGGSGSTRVLAYHADGLGSVRALTDAAGVVVQTYRTDEYGVAQGTQGRAPSPLRGNFRRA